MIRREIDTLLTQMGYRFFQSNLRDTGIYYKYYQEGFHLVVAMDLREGNAMTPEQHRGIIERVLADFYHPQSILNDFPDGFPVYHVEALTLLIGDDTELLKRLCMSCANTWAYLSGQRRLLIYENQPGDFFGLRQKLESMGISDMGTGASHPAAQQGIWERMNRWLYVTCKIRVGEYVPYITIGLIAANVIVYLMMELFGDTQDGVYIAMYGGLYPPLLTEEHEWWRLLTSGFIHFGAAHLVNNMLLLYCMGSRLECVTGHARMLVIYLIALLGGSMLSFAMMMYTGDYAVSAGASGAVYGIIGGFLWMAILHRGRLQGITVKGLIFMILLMIYYGVSSSGVDNWGHMGGLLSGFLVTMILCHRKYQKY